MIVTTELFLLIVVGSLIGLVMGALPGLTVTMTVVLCVSLTYGWPMDQALAFIVGAFSGGVMGGSISAISLNIPGTAAAVATTFDGFMLKKRGEPHHALGIALFVSLLGGLFGLAMLALAGPLLGKIALKFGPQEYFLITLWGITLVSVLSKGHAVKGLISACIGLFIGMIGMDPQTGYMRFTFGTELLSGGVSYILAMIGLFGMKEVFVQLNKSQTFKVEERYRIRDLLPKWSIMKKVLPTTLWSGPIGWIIGLLPGTGGDIGALVSYGTTTQLVKNPSRRFGEGAYEGVAAPEVANDAAIGGATTTMLTLGIPGDSVTAVILGAFILHGLQPGPLFMASNPEYFSMVVWFLFIATVISYGGGLFGANAMLKMLNVPKWYLIPAISILCVVGSYALMNSINDVIFMLFFGIIGYVFEKAGYPVGPMVLAMILGKMIEENLRLALIITGSVPDLLFSFLARPYSLILVVLIAASFLIQYKLLFSQGKKS